MDPMLQRLGDVTIQRLEKPKENKVGSQNDGNIVEKEEKTEQLQLPLPPPPSVPFQHHQQQQQQQQPIPPTVPLHPSMPSTVNMEDMQSGSKRNFDEHPLSLPGPSSKRGKFEDFKLPMDEYSMNSYSDEMSDYESEMSEMESDSELPPSANLSIIEAMANKPKLPEMDENEYQDEDESQEAASSNFLENLVQEPFLGEDEIKVERPDDDYEYDIKEKLKEMGEISFETVKKGDSKPKKPEVAETEVSVVATKKAANEDEGPSGERKGGNMRRNIREVMDETKLEESTLAAQRQEVERLRRVQEQQRLIREVQRQMAQERVISLLQGNQSPKASTSGTRIGNTVLVKLPNGQTKPMTKLGKKPLELMRVPKGAMPLHQKPRGGFPPMKKSPPLIMPPHHLQHHHHHHQQQQQQMMQHQANLNLTPSVSIAPVGKRPMILSRPPSESDSDNEESLLRKPIGRPKQKEQPVATIDISSDDDCIVVSESENDPTNDEVEDPTNSGMHTNDEFNQPDDQGRVVINIGHPEDEDDIYLAPQIARIIKPHQIGGIRFLYDNLIESTKRFETSTGFGCILAHSMGLGKTLQVVTFSDIFLRHTPARTILCIMPINTLQNWLAEYNMWLPTEDNAAASPLLSHGEVRPRNFNLHVLNDSHKTLAARAKVIHEWKTAGGVLLIGYEQYRLLSLRKYPKSRSKKPEQRIQDEDRNKLLFDDVTEALVKPGPDLVICDEGHRIKNSHASISQALKQMRTKRRVVLTGYPLQNNLMEYWCMVDFVRPNYLGTKTEFCNMFERPIQNGQCIDSTEADIKLMRYRAHVLHSLLLGFVQRRSHRVLQTALPQKEEYVLLVRMTEFQRTLYETFMNEVVRTQTVPNPLKAFAVCCKIWNHPDVLYYFLKKQAKGEAVDIDLEEVSNSTVSSETPGKTKSRAKKPAKGKNAKPAASVTPYNTNTVTENSLPTPPAQGNNNFPPNQFNNPTSTTQNNFNSSNFNNPNFTEQPNFNSTFRGTNQNENFSNSQNTGTATNFSNATTPTTTTNFSNNFNNVQNPQFNSTNSNSSFNTSSNSSSQFGNQFNSANQSYTQNSSSGNFNTSQNHFNNVQNNQFNNPSTSQNYNNQNFNVQPNQQQQNFNQNQSNNPTFNTPANPPFRNNPSTNFGPNQSFGNNNFQQQQNNNFQNFQQQQNYWNNQDVKPQEGFNFNNFSNQQQQQFNNQNQMFNNQWIKKEVDITPIKTEISDIKPKINILSDIKITNVYDSMGNISPEKKINILSDIKLEAKKEEPDYDEMKHEFKNDFKPDFNNKGEAFRHVDDEEVKIMNDAIQPIKGTPVPPKEDTGIPYDWAKELLKDYIPGCIENSAKMEILFCIIKESLALGDRLLVFSQSLITLDLIEQFLQMNIVPGDTQHWAKNVNYYRLDGSTSALEREKLINEFNSNSKVYVFLVSTRAGSLGINLIGANRVVVLDASWNPCHDTQAVCRVYRYGQKKQCFVYRLVVDNCLEKKIYDRQINKQGMSDRVVDECNPDAHLTMKDVSTLCWDDEQEVPERDWSHTKDNYIDLVLQKVLDQHGKRFNKEPFQHESLLIDRKDKQLSQQEKRLAKKGYEREKQASRQPSYNVVSNPRGHRPVASVRPMQQGNERPTRWIPAEHWQRQGMTAQEMTLPLDVVIPTNQPDKGNIVLKAGQKVLVLKSPKGVYMQLESGKIVAIKTAIKVRGKAEDEANKVKASLPAAIKNNSAISVLPQKRPVKPFSPGGMAKLNMRSMKQAVPNLVNQIHKANKKVQMAKTRPYQIGGDIAKALRGSDIDSHAISSSEDERSPDKRLGFPFRGDGQISLLKPHTTSRSESDEGEMQRSEEDSRGSSKDDAPTHMHHNYKNFVKQSKSGGGSALQQLEQSTSAIISESKQPFQETLDSITSSYQEDKLSDQIVHETPTGPSQPIQIEDDSPTESEEPYEQTPQPPQEPIKTEPVTPEYGYNNYYGYNHTMQPYPPPPPPPQGYPYPPQPPPYDMNMYPPPQQQQPPYNYGMYPQGYPPPPPQQYPPPPPQPYEYAPPPPQPPMYGGYPPYPPQQYPPPPQAMYPPPAAPYPEYQYPPAAPPPVQAPPPVAPPNFYPPQT